MRLTLGNKPRLWGVLALTVVAAIAIIVKFPARAICFMPKRCPLRNGDSPVWVMEHAPLRRMSL
jgi:hypothetical protein